MNISQSASEVFRSGRVPCAAHSDEYNRLYGFKIGHRALIDVGANGRPDVTEVQLIEIADDAFVFQRVAAGAAGVGA